MQLDVKIDVYFKIGIRIFKACTFLKLAHF